MHSFDSIRRHAVAGLALLILSLLAPVQAAEPGFVDEKILDAFVPRCIGPCNMGGRIVDVAIVPQKPTTMYVATASGGLWKTLNNGTTWSPVFERETTISIGDVAVAPSNPDVVWVGTGEANPRNSVSWGDGVYKSTDAGKTWQNMGLKDSEHIGRIVIHSTNPDVVYVAAMGHLWGPNSERGLYKTTDGGKNWTRCKFVNDDTGFIDVAIDPANPEILYAAAYQCRRDAFSGGNPAVQYGPGSGLFKTTDGGETWMPMTKGLPARPLGRCGLDIFARDSNIVYAVIQTDKTPTTTTGQPPKTGDNVETGGIFRSTDKGESWTKVNDLCPRPFYYGQIRIDPNNHQRLYVLGVAFYSSNDGGKTFSVLGGGKVHADHHALWIDPRDSDHLVLGCDGGLNFTYDRGANWEHVNNLPIAQFYAIGLDMGKPYRVYGGLQDNGSWGAPNATPFLDGVTVMDWRRIMGADGFYCQVDPTDADTVYAESQYGGLSRIQIRSGESVSIRPRPPANTPAYRFNWSSPILLSSHNSRLLYFAGNHLFRSYNRGGNWEIISPDLTRGTPGPSGNTGHTITTIAESPIRMGLLYAGTDDGRVHMSRDGGAHWIDLSEKIPSVPSDRWITRLECSRFAEGTAYLAIDRHRNDDRKPYLFKTTDFGASWQPIANNLPDGSVLVIREDLRNKNLLFAGTEFGLFLSLDGGAHWQRLNRGFPTVAVHDLVIHPRDRDLVIATHGRGIYIMNVAPLEEMTNTVLAEDVHLFDIKSVGRGNPRGSRLSTGGRDFQGANPSIGATIDVYLKKPPVESARITINDALGNTIARLPEIKTSGLHRQTWNLRQPAPAGQGAGGNRGAARTGPADSTLVPAGDYVARIRVGNKELVKIFRVEANE